MPLENPIEPRLEAVAMVADWPMEQKRAYCGGYFDGEGCISVGKTKGNKYGNLIVRIVSRDMHSLALMSKAIGGRVEPAKRIWRRKLFHYGMCPIYGRKAQAALEILLPYLITKKERAEKACSLDFTQGRVSESEYLKRLHFAQEGSKFQWDSAKSKDC
jgi:hypothetical protein